MKYVERLDAGFKAGKENVEAIIAPGLLAEKSELRMKSKELGKALKGMSVKEAELREREDALELSGEKCGLDVCERCKAECLDQKLGLIRCLSRMPINEDTVMA